MMQNDECLNRQVNKCEVEDNGVRIKATEKNDSEYIKCRFIISGNDVELKAQCLHIYTAKVKIFAF